MAITLFKYMMGEEMRERASAASSASPPKLVVTRRGYFEGQPAYMLDEADSGEFRGWFSEDMLEPYDVPSAASSSENSDEADSG